MVHHFAKRSKDKRKSAIDDKAFYIRNNQPEELESDWQAQEARETEIKAGHWQLLIKCQVSNTSWKHEGIFAAVNLHSMTAVLGDCDDCCWYCGGMYASCWDSDEGDTCAGICKTPQDWSLSKMLHAAELTKAAAVPKSHWSIYLTSCARYCDTDIIVQHAREHSELMEFAESVVLILYLLLVVDDFVLQMLQSRNAPELQDLKHCVNDAHFVAQQRTILC